jgi:hypothetical protein
MNFLRKAKLSKAASDLVEFDVQSIDQVVSSQHLAKPDVWLADPEAYEKNGRVLRDSDSPRMLAYSRKDQVLYATDGCNCCTRRVQSDLRLLASDQLQEFALHNELRVELLERLIGLL